MPATERLSLLIESQTRGSRDVNKLAEELNKVSTIAERSNQRVEKSSKAAADQLGQVSGRIRSAVSDPLGAATQVVGGFTSKLGVAGVAVGGFALGFGALTGAAFGFMRQMGQMSDMMLDFSDRTGLSVDQVDKLQAMSKIAGVNMGVMERAAGQLAQNLSDTGASGDRLRKALRELNVETITATGGQREMGPVIWDTIKGIAQLTSQTEQAAKANTILGISGKELVPLIRNYQEMSDRVARLGFGNDGQLIREIDETRKSMVELGLQWEILKRKLAVPAKGLVDISIAVLNSLGGSSRPGTAPDGYIQGQAVAGGYGPVLPGIAAPNLTPSAGPAYAAIAAQRARLAAENARVRAAFLASPEGMQARFSTVKAELGILQGKLQSGLLSSSELSRYQRLQQEQEGLQSSLNPAKPIPESGILGYREFYAKPFDVAGARYNQALGVAPGVPFFGTGPGTNMAEIDPARGAEVVANLTKRRVDLMKQNLDYEVQITKLLAGPGGEVAAINDASARRIETAERIYAITKDQAQLELETAAAVQEREVALLQLRRQGMTEYRDNVLNAFDSLISGGQGGLSSFFRSQGLGTLRGIVGNVAEQTYRPGLLSLPGQGTAESPNLLGKLLAGTPFGLDPASATMDNTRATIENTAALRGASITGLGRGLPGGVLQGAGGPLGTVFSAIGGKGGAGGMLDPNLIGLTGAGAAIPSAATGLLGTLGAIAPWIGVGLAGAGIVASLLPDPKQERAKQIELRIETARITVEGPAEFHLAGGTNEAFDYDFTGKPRVYQMSDEEVANSVVRASQAGHRINEEMRSAVLG